MRNAGSALMGIGRAMKTVLSRRLSKLLNHLYLRFLSTVLAVFCLMLSVAKIIHARNQYGSRGYYGSGRSRCEYYIWGHYWPDLDGEIIVTVVATGFDASYFSNRQAAAPTTFSAQSDDSGAANVSQPLDSVTKTTEKDMEELDMSIKDDASKQVDDAADFTNETPMPNIWAIQHDEARRWVIPRKSPPCIHQLFLNTTKMNSKNLLFFAV